MYHTLAKIMCDHNIPKSEQINGYPRRHYLDGTYIYNEKKKIFTALASGKESINKTCACCRKSYSDTTTETVCKFGLNLDMDIG